MDERHEAEATWFIRTARSKGTQVGAWVEQYLAKVEKHRGKAAAERIRVDARERWNGSKT